MSSFLQQEHNLLLLKLFWNFCTFIFGYFGMLYRKMYLFSSLLLMIVTGLTFFAIYPLVVSNLTSDIELLINPAVDLTLIIYLSMFSLLLGNYFYYFHARSKIRKAAKKHASVTNQRKVLAQKSCTSIASTILALILVSPIVLIGYQKLIFSETESKVQISEAIDTLNYASKVAIDSKNKNDRWPSNDEMSKLVNIYGYNYVEQITIVEQLIVVPFKMHETVLPEYAGKSFAIYGNESETDNSVNWTCGSIDIPVIHLPNECKRFLK